jgi:hypothetical protein
VKSVEGGNIGTVTGTRPGRHRSNRGVISDNPLHIGVIVTRFLFRKDANPCMENLTAPRSQTISGTLIVMDSEIIWIVTGKPRHRCNITSRY